MLGLILAIASLGLCCLLEFGTTAQNYDFSHKGDFRLKKYNEIWQEIQHNLKSNDQRELFVELLELDGLALIAKHETFNGKKSRFSEWELDQKLADLLKKHNLKELAKKFSKNERILWEDDSSDTIDLDEAKKLIQKHPNVLKLWQEAKKFYFTDEELLKLKRKLFDYAVKQEKHMQNQKTLKNGEENFLSSNSDEDELSEIPADTSNLLEEHGKLMAELHNLTEKIAARSSDGLFTNAKAKQLWELALKSGNFSKEQMEDLRNELIHFDNKLKKLNFARNDLTEAKFRWNKKGKYDDNLKTGEFRIMQQKFMDFERKADKLEQYLRRKVEL